MKKNHWTTLIVGIAIALGIYALPGITQTQPAAQQQEPFPQYVAVIDVAQVIKMHPEFMQKQEDLKKRVESAEKTFETRRQGITAKQSAMEASLHKPGSAEHQRMFDDVANELANFEKDAKIMQRQFALENSRIMYDTYKNIKDTIGRYARAKGIAQVTDYRVFEPDPSDPQSVAEDMDQRLVWFSDRLNITEFIIAQLYADRGMPMPSPQQQAAGAAGARTASPAPSGGMVR